MPYDIHGYLTEIDTGHIDTSYMNEKFDKWLKRLSAGEAGEGDVEAMLDELHGSFASLSQEQQRCAEMVIHAAQSYDLDIRPDMSFMDYINEFQARGKSGQVQALVDATGVDPGKLRALMALRVTEANINEFGRFDELKATADKQRAREYFSQKEGAPVPPFKVTMKLDALLRAFVLSGGFDLD